MNIILQSRVTYLILISTWVNGYIARIIKFKLRLILDAKIRQVFKIAYILEKYMGGFCSNTRQALNNTR